MIFKIEISQGTDSYPEVIRGQTESFEDAVCLTNLITSMCEDVEVTLTAKINNLKKKEK